MKKCIKSIVIAVLTGCLVISATACSSKEVSSGEKDVSIESSETVEEELTEEEKLLVMKCNDKTCNLSNATIKDLVLFLKEAKIQCNIDLGERLEPYGSDDYGDGYIYLEYYNKNDKDILVKDANIGKLIIIYDDKIVSNYENIGFLNGQTKLGDLANWYTIINSVVNSDETSDNGNFIVDEIRNAYIKIDIKRASKNIETSERKIKEAEIEFVMDRMVE